VLLSADRIMVLSGVCMRDNPTVRR